MGQPVLLSIFLCKPVKLGGSAVGHKQKCPKQIRAFKCGWVRSGCASKGRFSVPESDLSSVVA